MKTIENKAMAFISALTDVYMDEENRGLDARGKMEFSEDVSEDFTAMLVAVQYLFSRITGDNSSDIIDFTHVLNKLAVRYIMSEDADNDCEQ